MVKITQRHEECIGCGACVALDPENWEMDSGKAILKGATEENGAMVKTVDTEGNVKQAESACPVKCIVVE